MDNYINTPGSRPNDRYYEFEDIVKNNFSSLVKKETPLFKTDVQGLWDIYLDSIERMDGEDARSHYNCNACKHFIERYGNLATINSDGDLESVIWNIDVPEFFKLAVNEMNKAVKKARIKTVFISDTRTLGIPKTGEWTHLSVTLPVGKTNTSRLLTEGQVMAEKREHYGMLSRALNEFSLETINKAIELLQSETLYRGERVLGIATFFKELKELTSTVNNSKRKENIVWLAVAGAPTGFCSIKSSMIGTLLEDIQSGMYSYDTIKRRFDEKMDPSKYQRAQAAPKANAIAEAEKIVERLGIAESLERRYASIDEIPEFLWVEKSNNQKQNNTKKAGLGVFSHLKIKEDAPTITDTSNLPATVMTWDKFSRTVLPETISIEALIDNPNRFMALVTATDPSSENILQWGNRFSWYYHGGIDGEIKRRVEEAGGRYEDNEIRCSLIWEGRTDLDLHCITPLGNHIYYSAKRDGFGGYLDLDMNGLDKSSDHPVENMRWERYAREGHYRFYVHNYNERVNGDGTPFKVELEIGGKIYSYYGEPLRNDRRVDVFDFYYSKDKEPRFTKEPMNSIARNNEWNVESNTFVKVNAITMSPNLWGINVVENAGTHAFFLLDGCKDTSEGKGKGFFNEMLKPELRQIRKTLELFTSQTPIEGIENATACGIGYSKDQPWNLTLRIKTNNSTRLIKIDRFD